MIDITEILSLLPHRPPFLLIDKVISFEPGKSVIGLKNVTMNEPFFVGHFPGRPVMPGVLIVEALAQVTGVLAYKSKPPTAPNSLFYLASIDNARFKQPVVPGDTLFLHAAIIKNRSNVWKFDCYAMVEDKCVCTASMTSVEMIG